jgi:ABC-2 type transport system ATP-binding protein
MNDIEAVCRRLILIDKGHKLFDSSLDDFKARYEDGYMVKMQFTALRSSGGIPQWIPEKGYELYESKDNEWTVKVEKSIRSKDALWFLISRYDPENISIHEQDIEDIIKKMFL